uniref:KIB1-4 beta-propeller domain-containing protein n=1 Tax=Aegilops tauschii subsp. strangulata TaxID=200361 RepID=A0A452XNG7_AEGTS
MAAGDDAGSDSGGDGGGPGQVALEETTQHLANVVGQDGADTQSTIMVSPAFRACWSGPSSPPFPRRSCALRCCMSPLALLQKRALPAPTFTMACIPDGTFFGLRGEGVKEFFKLPISANYCMSCSDWLLFSHNGTCFLMDPFSKVTLTLPNLSSFCLVDEPVGIINGRDVLDEDMVGPLQHMDTAVSLHKVIRCSELLVAAIIDIGPLRTVAYCQPGSTSWLVSGLGSKVFVMDITCYEGMLYIIDFFNNLWQSMSKRTVIMEKVKGFSGRACT